MKFGRVIGTLVATQKYEGLEGVKFLIVQLLDRDLNPEGDPVVAADATAQAGPGELVFILASREAALALPTGFVPVDHAVAGIGLLVTKDCPFSSGVGGALPQGDCLKIIVGHITLYGGGFKVVITQETIIKL